MYSIRRATVDDAPILSALAARTFTETFGHLYPPPAPVACRTRT
jgi:hypothetical protein